MFIMGKKMEEEVYEEMDKQYEKVKFKKIKFSPDSTDLMSDFADK